MVALAQLAEHRIVAPKVVGSSPIGHPTTWNQPHLCTHRGFGQRRIPADSNRPGRREPEVGPFGSKAMPLRRQPSGEGI